MNYPINGYNIALDNVVCHFFDKETKLCKIYDEREKYAPWCLNREEKYGKGALPEGCLYLKEDPSREPNPKRYIIDVIDPLPDEIAQFIVNIYNGYNNLEFKDFIGNLKVRGKT